jgi:hypothetical protein
VCHLRKHNIHIPNNISIKRVYSCAKNPVSFHLHFAYLNGIELLCSQKLRCQLLILKHGCFLVYEEQASESANLKGLMKLYIRMVIYELCVVDFTDYVRYFSMGKAAGA